MGEWGQRLSQVPKKLSLGLRRSLQTRRKSLPRFVGFLQCTESYCPYSWTCMCRHHHLSLLQTKYLRWNWNLSAFQRYIPPIHRMGMKLSFCCLHHLPNRLMVPLHLQFLNCREQHYSRPVLGQTCSHQSYVDCKHRSRVLHCLDQLNHPSPNQSKCQVLHRLVPFFGRLQPNLFRYERLLHRWDQWTTRNQLKQGQSHRSVLRLRVCEKHFDHPMQCWSFDQAQECRSSQGQLGLIESNLCALLQGTIHLHEELPFQFHSMVLSIESLEFVMYHLLQIQAWKFQVPPMLLHRYQGTVLHPSQLG